jgi:L-fucose isomerase
MDMNPSIPKAVWGLNGTERPGAVYLAAVLAAYGQKGLPAYAIYGHDVQDANDTTIPEDVREKLLRFAKAAVAVGEMRGKSYLACGGVSMGIAGSIVNPEFFESYLGMRCEHVDMSEFIRRIDEGIYDQSEYEKANQWAKENCRDGMDRNSNPSDVKRKEWEWQFSVKCALIAKDLMSGNSRLKEMGYGEESMGRYAIAAGFQGQRQWTDHFPNTDFAEAILCSSFDWNGKRPPYIFATENDSLNAVSMLFGNLLTNTAQIFADVRTYWSPEAIKRVTGQELTGTAKNGILHLINSGAACLDGTGMAEIDGRHVVKPFWELTDDDTRACIEAVRWCPANKAYFRGGGFSSCFKSCGGMPVTMMRINLVKGLGPVFQLAEGWTAELPDRMHRILDERTDPIWPTTWFVPKLTGRGAFKDVYSVMSNWGANHTAVSYGHIGADLITLCAMLRIPVSLHNVDEERVFRPGVWNAFGTDNRENADYLACKTYGPLYG